MREGAGVGWEEDWWECKEEKGHLLEFLGEDMGERGVAARSEVGRVDVEVGMAEWGERVGRVRV